MSTNLNLTNRLFDIKLVPTKGKLTGFRVQVTLFNKGCPNTVLTHVVMCGDEYTAKSLKTAILQRRRLNLKHWHWTEVNKDLPGACTNRLKTKPFTLEI
ncbi:hypothetical protein FBPa1_0023 [Pseudomonas phage vB_PaeP_FBPa1]|nr:hypothetical protein FBPa1_0023 [Pseudomonas phage vB_PaeP_FBPa1]